MNGSGGSADTSRRLRGDEAALFAEYHERLIAIAASVVSTSRANVEDACSFAWTQLLRVQPERREIFAWLKTVAIREAIRLDGAERRRNPSDELDEESVDGRSLRDEALAALAEVAQLPARQLEVFELHVAGFSYDEIAQATEHTWTTVARHMARARKSLRPH